MAFARVRPEEIAQTIAGGDPSRPEDDESSRRMMDDLLSALILPPVEEESHTGVHHLSGQLARVRLPTLCALFEMEHLSGVLVVRRDIEEVHIYIDGGEIIDVEPLTATETAKARLRAVLAWEEGAFEFEHSSGAPGKPNRDDDDGAPDRPGARDRRSGPQSEGMTRRIRVRCDQPPASAMPPPSSRGTETYRAPQDAHAALPEGEASSGSRSPHAQTQPMIRAGVPTTSAKSGTSRVTTAPAPTKA